MALHKQPEKLTNPQIKAERDKISAIINNGKKEIEDLEKKQKELNDKIKEVWNEFTLAEKELKKIKERIGIESTKYEEILNEFHEKRSKFSLLKEKIKQMQEEKDEMIVEIKQEIENKIKLEHTILIRKKLEFDLEKKALEFKEKELKNTNNKLIKTIDDKKEEIKKITEIINKKDKTAKEIEESLKQLDTLKKSINTLEEKDKKIRKRLLEIREEQKVALRILKGTKDDREIKMADLVKREIYLKRKEKAIEIKEVGLRALEKYINKRGKTLQKHFDRNGMGHIKVFE